MKYALHIFQITVLSMSSLLITDIAYSEEKKTEQAQVEKQSDPVDLGITLNEGKKWKTDDSLRKGMLNIHQAIEKSKKQLVNAKLTQEENKALASQINKELIYVVNNCELAPKADASLHVIVGEMMKGVGEMSKDTKSAEGFSRINNALKAYPQFFDHPNWNN